MDSDILHEIVRDTTQISSRFSDFRVVSWTISCSISESRYSSFLLNSAHCTHILQMLTIVCLAATWWFIITSFPPKYAQLDKLTVISQSIFPRFLVILNNGPAFFGVGFRSLSRTRWEILQRRSRTRRKFYEKKFLPWSLFKTI